MRGRGGGVGGQFNPRATGDEDEDDATASVSVDGEDFFAYAKQPFVFGRANADGVHGLDQDDMGISAVAGSVELAWGVWWLINQSTKRPLLLEQVDGGIQLRVAPGHRYALTADRIDVLVSGAIYTHVLSVGLPPSYVASLRGGIGRLTTGTLTGAKVRLSARERDALTALCAGYLESFPYRKEHPNSYDEAARLLGGEPWTSVMVRKAVERVKERFAKQHSLYFDGPQANYDLTATVIADGTISGEDLRRLPGRRQS